jgi:nucleoid DNA-binding protein
MMAKAASDKPKPMSKSEIVASLAESTGLVKKDVVAVLDGVEALIGSSLGKKGPGVFALPGLLKIQVTLKKATPAKPGINPRTGETITIKAKPARKVVKVRALKKLKEMI